MFSEINKERSLQPRTFLRTAQNPSFELPEINLNHLYCLTDDTGILQHAVYSLPNRSHGYCTDDNARALIVAATAKHYLVPFEETLSSLSRRYLSFLHYAFNEENGRFRMLVLTGFWGDNDLHASLYNSHTGGCGDGLIPDGVNQNEGAESTLSWLLSLTTLHKLAAENSIVVNQYQKNLI